MQGQDIRDGVRMKLLDLFESAADYDAMFQFLDKLKIAPEHEAHAKDVGASFNELISQIKRKIDADISWAKMHLKKRDRIIWFLRYDKWAIIRDIEIRLNDAKAFHKVVGDDSISKMEEILKKETGKLQIEGSLPSIHALKTNLDHYIGMPIPQIQNFIFNRQTAEQLFLTFTTLEKEWREQTKGMLIPDESVKKFLDVGDGMAWYDLGKGYCPEEGAAAGHCGNVNGKFRPSETILSLRSEKDQMGTKVHEVYLTFILDTSDGTLGEMKGRGNDKPAERYHKYIIPLIMDPRIKGITGGGYKAQNNFSIFDLGDEEAKKLYDQKPSLATLGEVIRHFGVTPELMTKTRDMLVKNKDITAVGDGEEVKIQIAKEVADISNRSTEFEWCLKAIEEPDTFYNEYHPDKDILESNFNKKNQTEFLRLARKKYKAEAKANEAEVEWTDLGSVLTYMEEHAETDFGALQQAGARADESSSQSGFIDWFTDAVHEDLTMLIDIEIDGASDIEEEIEECPIEFERLWKALSISLCPSKIS